MKQYVMSLVTLVFVQTNAEAQTLRNPLEKLHSMPIATCESIEESIQVTIGLYRLIEISESNPVVPLESPVILVWQRHDVEFQNATHFLRLRDKSTGQSRESFTLIAGDNQMTKVILEKVQTLVYGKADQPLEAAREKFKCNVTPF